MTYLLHGHTSFSGMGWMDRIPRLSNNPSNSNSSPESGDIYIGGLYALYQPNLIADHGITHVLSVIDYHTGLKEKFPDLQVLHVDAEDHPRENLLREFERVVRWVDGAVGLGTGQGRVQPEDAAGSTTPSSLPQPQSDEDADAEATSSTPTRALGTSKRNALFIHCAMGKSRSATLLAAYLIWKHNLSPSSALEKICEARPVCEPNPGFREQLDVWARMCAAGSDGEKRRMYEEWEGQRFKGEYWEWGEWVKSREERARARAKL